MVQNDDVYRKVGRGGAGNYHQANPVDAASRDLEAQELNTSVAAPPDTSAPLPARAGRGGAGNYVDPANLPDAEQQEKLAAAVNERLKLQAPRNGLAGRGGAGNWEYNSAVADEEKEKETGVKTDELERKVKEEVELGLKMPEKAHHGPEKTEV